MSTRKRRSPNNIMRLVVGLVLALIAALAVAAGALALSANSFRGSDQIARNVRISGVEVGGLRGDEALSKVRTEWLAQQPADLVLKADSKEFTYSRQDLGAKVELEAAVDDARKIGRRGNLWQQIVDRLSLMQSAADVAVQVSVDEARLGEQLEELAGKVNHPPVDARVTITGSDQVQVLPGKVGIVLDENAAAGAVTKALQGFEAGPVTLPSKEKEPNIQAADLAHLEVVLGSYSTPYQSGKVDRTHNLSLAIKAINGRVIPAGGEFSANQAIGKRDESRGFREAPIFVNGEITPSTGGGVCQIATTVYNAALLAGLPILERRHHSMPVTYAAPGRDATVYWGQSDLRFRNNTGAALVLLASMDGDRVYVRLIGKRDAKKKVKIDRSGISSLPFTTVEKPDPTLEVGKKKVEEKGRTGIRVTVTRIITQPDGTEDREVLHTDTYQPYKQVVLVGTKKPATPPGGAVPQLLPNGKPAPGKPAATKPGAKPSPPKPGAKKPAPRKPVPEE